MKKLLLIALAAIVSLSASAFKVDTLTMATPNLPVEMKITVIAPDGEGPYPSLYLLNGYTGNYRDWAGFVPELKDAADRYGMVLVMPSGMDSWYWNSPVDTTMRMESAFTDDLIPMVDRTYPTIPSPDKRAITGLSMGGHGGMWLGVRHPELFGALGSTSGGVDFRPFKDRWKLKQWLGSIEDNAARWDEYTVATKVDNFKANGQAIIFDCGSEDFFADVNRKLHEDMLKAGVPHTYISRPGKHNWPYWRNAIKYQLVFFNDFFSK